MTDLSHETQLTGPGPGRGGGSDRLEPAVSRARGTVVRSSDISKSYQGLQHSGTLLSIFKSCFSNIPPQIVASELRMNGRLLAERQCSQRPLEPLGGYYHSEDRCKQTLLANHFTILTFRLPSCPSVTYVKKHGYAKCERPSFS